MTKDLFIRLRSLFMRRSVERELDDELQFHLERQVQKFVEAGLSPEEAVRRTRLEFGGLEQVKEDCREARGISFIEELAQDAGYALRIFRRSPGVTAIAVVTLALGIGANTAVFSVINAMMLRSLPVRDPKQLVQVAFHGMHDAESFVGESFSYPLFKALGQDKEVFSELSAFDSWDRVEAEATDRGTGNGGEALKGQLVSANFFSMLGVNAERGRTFLPDEESADGGHPVAVISYAAWERGFARDPDVVGRKLLARGTVLTIIGVTPKHFSGVNPGTTYDFWIPLTMLPQVLANRSFDKNNMSNNWLSLIGRLKEGVSAAQATGRVEVLYQQARSASDLSQWSDRDRRDFLSHHIVLLPSASGADYARKEFSRPLKLLMGMVVLVLLIACANVTNLLLARARTREREIALRTALGARGWRLLRQLLTESVMLAVGAGALSLVLAFWASRALVAVMAIHLDVHPDLRVFGFTSLLALAAGVGAGIVPAVGALRKDQSSPLRKGSLQVMSARSEARLGSVLIVAQIALSMVVVFAAVLLLRTLRNLETFDPGFSRENVLLFALDSDRAGYKDQRLLQLYQELAGKIESLPGVRSASYSLITPISGGGWDSYTYVEEYTAGESERVNLYLNAVGPRFFETLGTPLLAGRSFEPQDGRDTKPVVVINQAMARRFFAGRDPIGKHVGRWKWNANREYEVVGVVGDAKYTSLREEVPPTAYLYLPQSPMVPGNINFETSSELPVSALEPEVRDALKDVDSRLSAMDMKTLAEQIDRSLDDEKFVCTVSSCFGALALGLACIGLYGVISYSVARRTNEIGLRVALGATKQEVFRMLVGHGARLVAAGLAIGLVVALVIGRALSSLSQMLYGVKANDPVTLAGVSVVLAVTALVACAIPALRALRIDPMAALRCE
jgi:predicted permease